MDYSSAYYITLDQSTNQLKDAQRKAARKNGPSKGAMRELCLDDIGVDLR